MKYRIEARIRKKRREARLVQNIELDEAKIGQRLEMGNIAATAEPQVIHAPDLVSPLEQTVAHVATDEASAARHQNSHELHLIPGFAIKRAQQTIGFGYLRSIKYHFKLELPQAVTYPPQHPTLKSIPT